MHLPLLAKTSIRYLLRHPWQIGLCILGVALGVAVVVSIDLANSSARAAFSLSTETIAGRATHQVVGGPGGLDEGLYRTLRIEQGIRSSAPIVDGYATLCPQASCDQSGVTVRVFGVDPFAEGTFRSYLAGGVVDSPVSQGNLTPLLSEPNAIVLAEETAKRYGIAPGATVNLRVGGVVQQVRVVALLAPSDTVSRAVLQTLIITDIATAQELLGMVGKLTQIDLILPNEQAVARVQAVLPPDAELVLPANRSGTIQQMTRAFELNLSALSLLALIVGMFLIYNTITFSVVQRRALIGTLRCIGVTRRQIFTLILSEAALISLVGSLLGLGLGIILGRGLVSLVTRTINDLYFVVTVQSFRLDPWVLFKGLALGVGATLVAAVVPAMEATSTEPRSALRRSSIEERSLRIAPRAAFIGCGLLVVATLLLLVPTSDLVLAFISLFGIVIGSACLVPWLTVVSMNLIRPSLRRLFGLLGSMAARDVVAALSRTSVAIAALMIAVSVIIGVGTMVGSFRQTVVAWLSQTIQADIYVAPPSNTANRVDTTVERTLVDQVSSLPGIVGRNVYRNVLVDTSLGPTQLVALERDRSHTQAIRTFKEGDQGTAWAAFDAGSVLVSEPFAYRTGLHVGDQVQLRTDRGNQGFPIAGIFYDYTSDRGVIFMARPIYDSYWDDRAISSFSLYVQPGTDIAQVIADIQAHVGGRQELVISSNRDLREGTLAIFDRTFAITAVLQILATIVAFVGILSALMALQLERARELGVLRATGLTPRQLWAVILSQTGLMGLVAGFIAMPLGIGLSLVLVYVINRRSFGWTLQLVLDPSLFAQALLVAVVAALLAGIYPAFLMSRTSPALALREE